ncbi:hypothetical protein GUITHDRAFT_113131 [Guillardia theta CCMP2712]|uniref:Uncharacterized protein n=1 Tax=Guillardia theta (strain CCMP2712) TaxID=905079 RepID=L1IYH0_GUITC|nr:hypothetical protein GUITHDRAFT_113131 [Guillardia theta CCMP2712]EKX40870.1 hypothetical protein GUITHDRAFT_113131 [Guillardia theta CCMP2712]|eukprot:XP_005827850.1 hypothetical protein GUITHDRAFT_113131 [Guillardia theta CCMP2712]
MPSRQSPYLMTQGNFNRLLMRRLKPVYVKFIQEVNVPIEVSLFMYQVPGCGPGGCKINFWLPLTRTYGSNSLWIESSPNKNDFLPLAVLEGQVARFYGNRCMHYTIPNDTEHTRITLDFRAVPGPLFDTDYELSREPETGAQMFQLGGYYSLAKYDQGIQEAKQESNQRPPMRTACACAACLCISRWAPELSAKPSFKEHN